MIILLIFSLSLFSSSYSIKGNKMIIKEKGKVVLLEGNVVLESENLYVETDSSIWNKEKDVVEGKGNIYFVYKATSGVISGKSEKFFYKGKEKFLTLKKIKDIMYNYKVDNSTSVVLLEGNDAVINNSEKTLQVTGEEVILKSEDFTSSGKKIFYSDNLKKIEISGLNYVKSEKKGVNLEGNNLEFFTDKRIILVKGNVRGKIELENVKSNKH